MRKPKLEMVSEGIRANTWDISQNNIVVLQSPYHMWRIKVQHIKIPWYLSWLIKNRETALQCKVDLTFYSSEDKQLFKMQGRWVNTPEISYISSEDQIARIIYPDTIGIGYHSSELLDCILQFDYEDVAYGWNNEAYQSLYGRNPRCKLEKDTYKVTVRLSGQNFKPFTTEFTIQVARSWQGTSLDS